MTIYVCRKCGKFFNSDTLGECPFCHMPVKPKYDKSFWRETITIPIDSVKYRPLNSETLEISDRQSIFMGNENPLIKLRWIHYPEKDKVQLCMAVSGKRHVEKMNYYQKNPEAWEEWNWIYLDGESVEKIIKYLQRNPQLLASWM